MVTFKNPKTEEVFEVSEDHADVLRRQNHYIEITIKPVPQEVDDAIQDALEIPRLVKSTKKK